MTTLPPAASTPRPYQARAIEAVRHRWAQGARCVCLVLPTGGGKTFTAARLCNGSRVLWIAHRRELIDQAMMALRGEFPDRHVAAIAPGHDRVPSARVQVATVQTLLARGDRPAADLIVYDEFHHYVAEDWHRVAEAYPGVRSLGLTATPERADGKPLGDMADALVVGATYSELLSDGYLVPCRVYQPPTSLGARELAQDPLAAYQRYTPGAQAFVFVGSVRLAYEQADRFTSAGIPSAVVEAKTKRQDRARAITDFSAGRVRCLVNVYALTEGVDVPSASAIILARGCDHVGMYLQIAGRILRPYPGKAEATLVDLTGASLQHGLPTADRAYSLEGDGISGPAVQALRNCLKCGACFPSRPGPCPECGYDPPRIEPPPPRIYSMELREVFAGADTPADAKRTEYARLRRVATERGFALYWVIKEYRKLFAAEPIIDDATDEERVAEMARLLRIGRDRGFKPGFAAVRYRSLFGNWPPDSIRRRAEEAISLESVA